MAYYKFRQVAIPETDHWNLDGTPLEGVPTFGIYLYCEGERTYCCSMSPSQWCEFSRNEWLIGRDHNDESDPVAREIEKFEYENGGESGSYFDFHHIAGLPDIFKSASFTIRLALKDYRKPDDTKEEARDRMRDSAFDSAREYCNGNLRAIDVIDKAGIFTHWQAQEQAKRPEPLPLFDHAGLGVAPLVAPFTFFQRGT